VLEYTQIAERRLDDVAAGVPGTHKHVKFPHIFDLNLLKPILALVNQDPNGVRQSTVLRLSTPYPGQ
jgi:hypothetical protein